MTGNPYNCNAYFLTRDFANLQKDGKNSVRESLSQEQEKTVSNLLDLAEYDILEVQ
jgi:hypothetical protein